MSAQVIAIESSGFRMKRRDDLLAATRDALKHWAALSYSELPGWPTRSAIVSALTGRGTGRTMDMNEEAKAVEAAINKLYQTEPDARRMILLHYLSNGTVRQKMKHLHIGQDTYYFRLEQAEWAVKVELGY